MENKREIFIFITVGIVVIGCYLFLIYWEANMKQITERYCTVTYKIHYPNETAIKSKTVFVLNEYDFPKVKARFGHNRLVYRGAILERTTAPIEIISYKYFTKKYKGSKNKNK